MADWTQVAAKIAQAGAPVLGGVLGGPAGGALGGLIGGLVGQALGVPPDPQAVGAAIDADPAGAAAKLQTVEAEHKSAAELAAQDIQNARQMTVDLARAGSPIQWGSSIISFVVVASFCLITFWAVYHGLVESPVLTMLLGVLISRFGTTVDFWLGSSDGSRGKDATIAAAITAAVKGRR